MAEFYKSVALSAFVGIDRESLDRVLLLAGAPQVVFDVLERHTAREPYHVGMADAGYRAPGTLSPSDPGNTPRIVVIQVSAVQIDAGVNEIPKATCVVSIGRDAALLAAGRGDLEAASPIHLLERYLNRYVAAKIYLAGMLTTSQAGFDFGDPPGQPDEPVVLFDGLTVGPTRRGSPEGAELVLHLAHFTAGLTQSSVISAQTAAGTGAPAAYFAAAPPVFTTGVLPGVTPWGSLLTAVAGGAAAYTDFWGYRATVNFGASSARRGGIKAGLLALTQTDHFAWQAFAYAAGVGIRGCAAGALPTAPPNTGAAAALARLEPFYSLAGATELANWGALDRQIRAAQAAHPLTPVTRADLAGGANYAAAGYRYGVPVALSVNQVLLGPLGFGPSFAGDLASIMVHELAPMSAWEVLTARIAARFQVAVLPMADRGVVAPFQPLLDTPWQRLYATEVFGWEDDVQTPLPVRGVVLTSDRVSAAGAKVDGNDPARAAAAQQQMAAVYDSCEDGVFVFRDMPGWLSAVSNAPWIWAGTAFAGPRMDPKVPWALGPRVAAADDRLLAAVGATGGGAVVGALVAGLGRVAGAPAAPPALARTLAVRYAQALFQQERTRGRSVYLTGRFRYDIGPGSVVTCELPGDRYVRAAVGANRDTTMTGMVIRVTLVLDAEAPKAFTAFQLGFVRTQAETLPTSPLYATGHPFWATVCRGVPWADAAWVRAALGAGDTLVPVPFRG